MLLPDPLKENVDGLQSVFVTGQNPKNFNCAVGRAPVDDAAPLENRDGYLWKHLVSVLREENDAGEIKTGGPGICYATGAP
jgi:hypothetical protein